MAFFVWNPTGVCAPEEMTQDQLATEMAIDYPLCVFCGEPFNRGTKVWHWAAASRITAHAECLKERASGIMRDLSEVVK